MFESLTKNWYALFVRSRHEKSVYSQLAAKQHEAFLPLYTTRHKWADRVATIRLPLFPGYVFCRFDPGHRSSVLASSGVIDVVRQGREPAPIDSPEIGAIQSVVQTPLFTEPYAGLMAGDQVVMSAGPLTGLTGTLVEIKNGVRLVLSVQLLNRSVLVEIDRDWVTPAQDKLRLGPKTANECLRPITTDIGLRRPVSAN